MAVIIQKSKKIDLGLAPKLELKSPEIDTNKKPKMCNSKKVLKNWIRKSKCC